MLVRRDLGLARWEFWAQGKERGAHAGRAALVVISIGAEIGVEH